MSQFLFAAAAVVVMAMVAVSPELAPMSMYTIWKGHF